MVGVVNPDSNTQNDTNPSNSSQSSGSSSNDNSQSSSSASTWRFPSVKLMKLPQGKYSPKPDERCLIYCSQSARGRTERDEPWCRSICIRRIFAHEIPDTPPDTQSQSQSTTPPVSTKGKHLLPPEGQGDSPSDIDSGPRGPKYWEQGWYIWMSKNRWAAQEKVDMMMMDLDRQDRWMKKREKMKADWKEQNRGNGEGDAKRQSVSIQRDEMPTVVTPPSVQPGTGVTQSPQSSKRPPPFVVASDESLLIRLPPPLSPLSHPFKQLMAPTGKALGMFQQSVSSGGGLRNLMGQVKETAWTGKPWALAGRMYQYVKDNLINGGSGNGSSGDKS